MAGGAHMKRLRLQLLIGAGACCSVISSSVLGAVLGPKAEQAIVQDTPGSAPRVPELAYGADKRGSEMIQRLVRRQHEAVASLQDDRDEAAQMNARLVQGQVLNRMLQSVGENLEPGPTRDFLHTLRLCVPCRNFERFGDSDGFVMCTDALQGVTAALSYGIDGSDGWGMALASRYRIQLHEYDCINPRPPEVCAGCSVSFHNECLGSVQSPVAGRHYKTLGQQLMDVGLSNSPDRSLLLKIDIDNGMEWRVLAEEPPAFLQKFRQIVVVYHETNKIQNHQLYLQATKKLEAAGFAVAHLHGNNMKNGMSSFDQYQLPVDIEVTYVQQMNGGGCSAGIPYHVPQDKPSSDVKPELGAAVLPRLQAAASSRTIRQHTTTLAPDQQPGEKGDEW